MPTASWVSNTLDVPVIDNYWQTESGWPIMAIARGLDDRPTRLGSPGVPMYGYNVQLLNEVTGEPCGVNEKGMLVVEGPLPPGCIHTIWGDDGRFVKTYWSLFSRPVYATFDWGIPVPFDDGQTILEAARKAGHYIPSLCWHKDFPPHGSCKLCVVKAAGRHVSACATPAKEGWEVYKGGLTDYLDWLTKSAPDLRHQTGSECSGAIQRFSSVTVSVDTSADAWTLSLGNFHDEAWLMFRANNGTPGRVRGGSLTKLTGNLYLLKATNATVHIERKTGGEA